MKQINNYIQEKLKLNKSIINKHQYILFPESKKELIQMIGEEIKKNGNKCSLNHIDVSKIDDMRDLFSPNNKFENFNGNISEWNVSNVKDMSSMFSESQFNGDISKWDVSKVKRMNWMFIASEFNGDISNWDVSNVDEMFSMFNESQFNGDISKWDVSNVKNLSFMFTNSKFNQNISSWKINPSHKTLDMFYNCSIKEEYKPKSLQKIK